MIIEKITQSGGRTTSSLSGRLVFDETRGRIGVTNSAGVTKSLQDEEGFRYFNNAGQERSKLAEDGLTITRSDNTRYGKFGQADSGGRDILAVAKPGVDLKQEGI